MLFHNFLDFDTKQFLSGVASVTLTTGEVINWQLKKILCLQHKPR